MTKTPERATPAAPETPELPKLKCGLVMPISKSDGYPVHHWADVKDILYDAIREAGFEPNLVSDAEDAGVIQKRIIHNLFENPVVVCDVSGKNPNVMFELGLRLAFDKPTIIVKDEKTPYTFDTAQIEHLAYPSDLRFQQIVEFKEGLAKKVKATHLAAADPNYTTFLKHFGTFSVAKLEEKEVSSNEFLVEQMQDLRRLVENLSGRIMERKRSRRGLESESEDARMNSRIETAIMAYVHDHELRSLADIEKAQADMLIVVEGMVGGLRHFVTRQEYTDAFNKAYSRLFG